MRLLYFPEWVFTALTAHGYKRTDVLNADALIDTLSVDDLALLHVMNCRLGDILPSSIMQTFPYRSTWGFVYDKLRDATSFSNKVSEYLMNGTPEPWTTPPSNLRVEMLDEDTLVFTPIRPPAEVAAGDGIGSTSGADSADLIDRTIGMVYPYLSFPDLALTPMIRDLLIEKQIASSR